MNKIVRYAACACFLAMASCAFAATPVHSPFDGTWHTDLAKSKFSPKPLTFYIGGDWYHCVTCNPTFAVPADGQDHAVTGHAFDTMNIKVVDPHAITETTRKDGKVVGEETLTVSDDGKILTVKGAFHPINGAEPYTFEVTAKRSGIAPAGVHATSGDWIREKESGSANGLTTTYKLDGDELTMTEQTGETYTAKLDGGDFPVKGAYGWDAVSLKKIDAHTIEETDKRNGAVTDVWKITVAGSTMTVVHNNKLNDRTSTYIAHKQ